MRRSYQSGEHTANMEREPAKAYYNPDSLIDAPEFHEYSRAMGTLTWGTWDHGLRPLDQRISDFVHTFPPDDPARFQPGGNLARNEAGTFGPGLPSTKLIRFLAQDWRPGSLHELLARYGLKTLNAPKFQDRAFTAGSFRDTAKRRNQRLRMLHGGVDIEPSNMDAAKAELLDFQEKKKAADQVRDALKQMHEELKRDSESD
jgi:hypothetical protein